MTLFNITKNKIITDKLYIADTFFKKLVGLIPKKNILEDECLMIKGCFSIHTCFMRFDIDAVFTDKNMKVIDIVYLKPWRFSKIYPKAFYVFEFKVNFVYDKISLGDILKVR